MQCALKIECCWQVVLVQHAHACLVCDLKGQLDACCPVRLATLQCGTPYANVASLAQASLSTWRFVSLLQDAGGCMQGTATCSAEMSVLYSELLEDVH